MGLVTDYADGQWYIGTFVVDPSEGEVSRRTAFIRNNGAVALKGTKDPNVIPLDPNVIPKDPNSIPLDPNVIPK